VNYFKRKVMFLPKSTRAFKAIFLLQRSQNFLADDSRTELADGPTGA
jgi:hypothetical protein